MPMLNLPVDELWHIAAAGGGLTLDAAVLSTDDLWQVAAAASQHKAQIVVVNAHVKSPAELCHIAAGGKGSVLFE